MKVPLSWLREFVEVPVEPTRIADALTSAGLAVDSLDGSGDATVLDIDVTTNRVDCMNVYGVAREVSVLYRVPLKPLDLSFPESGEPASSALDVAIDASDLCPRFCARVLDVRMGPSPSWLRERLEAVGVRSINNVVDLTNYVMMEMGQPTHAFDLEKIPGRRLLVRWAREGEKLVTLDGATRTLTPRHGVVAAGDEALGLAGIMGGGPSEVSEATRTVALEAAYWDPLSIRRAARSLGMHTEASHRFERVADPEAPPVATARLAHLLVKIGAGTVRPGLIDQYPAARPPVRVALRRPRIDAVLGTAVPVAESETILRGLGFGLDPSAEGWGVSVPTWRGDVAREADLIEEVGRHHGLDKVQPTIPPAHGVEGLRPEQRADREIRRFLSGAGLTEVVNYAFGPASIAEAGTPAIPLANPISEEQSLLRTSLVWPGLLTTLVTNLRHGRRDVRVFEIGRVFAPAEPLPRETRRLGILWTGAGDEPHWSRPARPADVFDVKGLVEAIAGRLGVTLGVRPEQGPSFLHPGRAAAVLLGELRIGFLGAVHPDAAARFELREATVVAELDLEPLLATPASTVRVAALPRFPGTSRDLSLLLDARHPAADLERAVRAAAGELLVDVAFRDRYDRPPIPAGKVSVTISLWYQHPARTLTGEEVQASVEAVVGALKSQGIEIRGT